MKIFILTIRNKSFFTFRQFAATLEGTEAASTWIKRNARKDIQITTSHTMPREEAEAWTDKQINDVKVRRGKRSPQQDLTGKLLRIK